MEIDPAKARDWASIDQQIEDIVTNSNEPFSPETVSQARDLLAGLRVLCPLPEVAKGYWSTIRFMWADDRCEIEVHNRNLEFYRFHQGRTEILQWQHLPGEPIPAALLSELPRI
jgi:hypothetical protein